MLEHDDRPSAFSDASLRGSLFPVILETESAGLRRQRWGGGGSGGGPGQADPLRAAEGATPVRLRQARLLSLALESQVNRCFRPPESRQRLYF